jgi:hypothetical protein
MKCWSSRLLLTLLVLMSIAGAARADMMIPWTYTVSRSPITVPADTSNNSTGGINMSVSPLAPGTNVIGDSDISVVKLTTTSSNTTGVDTFTNAHYSLTIALTDLSGSTPATGSVTFNGVFHNSTLNTTSADIKNTFLDPTTQNIILNGHDYTVSLNSYVAPGIPDDPTAGSIGAHVSITDATGVGSVQSVPEPSTLLLAGLALPAGLAWWRARGRRRDAAND